MIETIALVVGGAIVYLAGAGIASETRENEDERWESVRDYPNPLINLLWPFELTLKLVLKWPVVGGMKIARMIKERQKRKALPEARIIDR